MKCIYLDYNATTPLDPRVFEAMAPYFMEKFGNPSSSSHSYGWDAESAVCEARKKVADLIGAKPTEIVFTAGSTEANNWVISELTRRFRLAGEKAHFITSVIEHPSVLAPMKRAEEDGVAVTYLPINSEGRIELTDLKAALRPETKLVSLMAANNELGSLNPMAEIGALCHDHKIYFHSDATQWIGKLPLNVDDLKIDLLSVSGHKLYGPKGVGALYIRSQNPKVDLPASIVGGGQERGRRSGTLNVPGIVGLGEAAKIAVESMAAEAAQLQNLKTYFLSELEKAKIRFRVNGSLEHSLPNTLNITFFDLKPEHIQTRMAKLAVSSTSACHSGGAGTSPVLAALGLTSEEAKSSLRISFGRGCNQEQLKAASDTLISALNHSGNATPSSFL